MAPPPPSSSSPGASPHHHALQSSIFTSIQEGERENVEDEGERRTNYNSGTPSTICSEKRATTPKHHPTPLQIVHQSKYAGKRRSNSGNALPQDRAISCSKCRPNTREKISVAPLDNYGTRKQSSSFPSPNGVLKAIFSSLTRKSPRSTDSFPASREEQWKTAVAELSHKLLQATRKRDEAVLEASTLQYSFAEMEKKMNKLEIYCHNLKYELEVCNGNSPHQTRKKDRLERQMKLLSNYNVGKLSEREKPIEHFVACVSESRTSIRLLSRTITTQLTQAGGKVFERVSTLLRPYDLKINSKNPRNFLFYIEALLNRSFFEDFESIRFQKNSATKILNPIERIAANYSSYCILERLTWEEVLSKGTKHFSEDFSGFCDRKMSEIVAMLGWTRAWPEALLQAFFSAAKSVWMIHLLANSIHPPLIIFRVDKGARFEPAYMEETGGERMTKLVPAIVQMTASPGFYVHADVVRCKVLCRYTNGGRVL